LEPVAYGRLGFKRSNKEFVPVKHLLPAIIVAAAAAAPAFADDVSVSIGISRPGFYGQINIGELPRAPVIYAQPVVIQRAPDVVVAEPIYLHVPPGHEKHWRKHCAEYAACGRPVYFVREEWYQKEYAPRHHDHDDKDPGDNQHHDRGHGHGNGEGRGHNDRND
jgi:hypothetical protein